MPRSEDGYAWGGRIAGGIWVTAVLEVAWLARISAMPAMSCSLVRPIRDAMARRWARLGLLLATLVGLVVMHQLAGAPEFGGRDHRPAGVAAKSSSGHCLQQDGDCPPDRHGHQGRICQASPPSGIGAAPPVLAVMSEVPPAAAVVISPRTGAPDAANGSGCGPPSLTQLSISRT